uniref:ATP synthase F0 subunit 8 n=1 Tax=Jakoba libera TaxID=143017 RepID=M4QC84_JAKLI|nr:ATP synthase F0 subunit 8 [Jakoba libera]AGH24179.1 ATP synthase F0 subunit 8 [Jakoba libera]
MPQLNSLTYFSQVFWLVLFFCAFYAVLMYLILPTLYRTMRLRQRKLQVMQSAKGNLKQEESQILNAFDQSLALSLAQSRKSLQDAILQTNQWISISKKDINLSYVSSANQQYLQALHDLAKEKFAFQKMIHNTSN